MRRQLFRNIIYENLKTFTKTTSTHIVENKREKLKIKYFI